VGDDLSEPEERPYGINESRKGYLREFKRENLHRTSMERACKTGSFNPETEFPKTERNKKAESTFCQAPE